MTATATTHDTAAPPPKSANFFISGHSLTDQPLPSNLAAIATSLGTSVQWNRQYIVGSAIRQRTRGLAEGVAGWSGYRQGDNREGHGLDVVAELRQPRTVSSPARYDVLIITEQNGLLETMMWHDTVRHLRHYHERFIEGNPKGQTFFYEPWVSLDSLDDPRRWTAFERQASQVWQCVTTRINLSLAAEGRADRITSLPSGIALAALVEHATRGAGVAGLSGGTVRETLARLFQDDVHLTPIGSYYMALVSYAAIFQRPPLGAWTPAEVSPELARTLQQFAAEFMAHYRATNRPLDMAQCRALLKESFINDFYAYIRDAWKLMVGPMRAEGRRLKRLLHWHLRVRRDNDSNPFHFDPSTDRTYWLPDP